MKKYTFIDHTADMGMIAYGNTLKELFTNAAMAVFTTIAELNSITETVSMKIDVEIDTSASTQLKSGVSSQVEELIVEWLRELLFQHEVEEIFFKRVDIQKLSETSVSAIAYGEPIDLSRHEFNTEIKNVTYHKLSVKKLKHGVWQAQVIFDL